MKEYTCKMCKRKCVSNENGIDYYEVMHIRMIHSKIKKNPTESSDMCDFGKDPYKYTVCMDCFKKVSELIEGAE